MRLIPTHRASRSWPGQSPYTIPLATGIASGSMQNLRPMRTSETWLQGFGLISQGGWICKRYRRCCSLGTERVNSCSVYLVGPQVTHHQSTPGLFCHTSQKIFFVTERILTGGIVILPFIRWSIISWVSLFCTGPLCTYCLNSRNLFYLFQSRHTLILQGWILCPRPTKLPEVPWTHSMSLSFGSLPV